MFEVYDNYNTSGSCLRIIMQFLMLGVMKNLKDSLNESFLVNCFFTTATKAVELKGYFDSKLKMVRHYNEASLFAVNDQI